MAQLNVRHPNAKLMPQTKLAQILHTAHFVQCVYIVFFICWVPVLFIWASTVGFAVMDLHQGCRALGHLLGQDANCAVKGVDGID